MKNSRSLSPGGKHVEYNALMQKVRACARAKIIEALTAVQTSIVPDRMLARRPGSPNVYSRLSLVLDG